MGRVSLHMDDDGQMPLPHRHLVLSLSRMPSRLRLGAAACLILYASGQPLTVARAQAPPPQTLATSASSADTTDTDSAGFDPEQLDALMAPIALYPDTLLTQLLMATTFALEVVAAARWVQEPVHKSLTGDALSKALETENWDPSVKSLVPFPQVLAQLNANLDWMQQVGYAFAAQPQAVLGSIQRLRAQAQENGKLQSTPQQVVTSEPAAEGQQTIIIQPAQPNTVYVPSYNPTAVYGAWPYPSYPPVALPPPPGYAIGTALVSGLAFGAGVAVTAGLWNWARPNWGRGEINVNVNRWNNINVNRSQIHASNWRASARPGGLSSNLRRPPAGPVGRPVRTHGLPANAIGRSTVKLPASAVNRPPRANTANLAGAKRPNLAPGSRPQAAALKGNGTSLRAARARSGNGGRANLAANHQAGLRGGSAGLAAQRPRGGAFGGQQQGAQAKAFAQRGGQSRQFAGQQRGGGGGGFGGGHRGGGGGGRVRHR